MTNLFKLSEYQIDMFLGSSQRLPFFCISSNFVVTRYVSCPVPLRCDDHEAKKFEHPCFLLRFSSSCEPPDSLSHLGLMKTPFVTCHAGSAEHFLQLSPFRKTFHFTSCCPWLDESRNIYHFRWYIVSTVVCVKLI